MSGKAILIIAPMDMECDILLSELAEESVEAYAGRSFHIGRLADKRAVIVRSGVGMANAALAANIGIEKFLPKAVIIQGIAGAHDPEYDTCDIVIGESSVLGMFKATETEWEFMPTEAFTAQGELRTFEAFPADKALVEAAKKIEWNGNVHLGRIHSLDFWNAEPKRIEKVRELLHTSCEEMETSGVAAAAMSYGVPHIGIRAISNNELKGGPFDPKSAAAVQRFVIELVKNI